jgi:hypothetical protein
VRIGCAAGGTGFSCAIEKTIEAKMIPISATVSVVYRVVDVIRANCR